MLAGFKVTVTPGGTAPLQVSISVPSSAVDCTLMPMEALPPGLTCTIAAPALIFRGVGAPPGSVPVPWIGTISVSSLAIKFNFASRLPVACGVKVTLMVQLLPGAKEAGQKLWNLKSPG